MKNKSRKNKKKMKKQEKEEERDGKIRVGGRGEEEDATALILEIHCEANLKRHSLLVVSQLLERDLHLCYLKTMKIRRFLTL